MGRLWFYVLEKMMLYILRVKLYEKKLLITFFYLDNFIKIIHQFLYLIHFNVNTFTAKLRFFKSSNNILKP